MSSRKALLLAVLGIFATAMVAEFTGLVHHDPGRALAASASETDAHAGGAEPSIGASETQLRVGIMGAFVVVCFYAVMRLRGAV